MHNNSWAQLLAYVTGLVNQRLLLQCEYLVAENRILRSHLPANLRLFDSERRTLAEIGKRLGRKLLSEVACVAKPDTILGWYRRLIARRFDGSKHRSYPGRPRVTPQVEALIVRMAKENGSWGYDRIAGVPSPTSAITSPTRLSETCLGATAFRLPQSAVKPPPGRTSSPRTCLCLRAPT